MRSKQFFVLIFLFLFISKSSFANNLELTKLLQCQDNKAVVLEQFKNSKHVFDGEMSEVYRATDSKSKVFGSPIKYIEYFYNEGGTELHYTLLNTKSFNQVLSYAEKTFKVKSEPQEISFEVFKQVKHYFESIQKTTYGYTIINDIRTVSFFKVNGFVAVKCDLFFR